MKEPGIIHLRNMPLEVKKYILKIQGETKEKKGVSQYSQIATIYQIIKEHKLLKKQPNAISELRQPGEAE